MGVNSLWDILGPTSRTVKLEALTRKKLAVDASIWIYQFLKAVRDSEGNALQLSHIVGFFRRICKLLYFGILPIFVFDGGAPALKRETIKKRRERREGKRESTTETAQRLLAILVQRQRQDKKRQEEDNMIYFDDLPNQHPKFGAAKSLQQPSALNSDPQQPVGKRRFIPKDEYHLPDIKKIKVQETDERLMPEEEFNELTLDAFDVVDGIDINSVDPKSPEFAELPMSTQYTILSHLRLKSRLRMGFTKEQLEDIFSNSMDFSKFQIQQVQKRNFFTQKLMDVSGMGDEGNATKRIAGEKDRKYALIRTDDGWSLSLQGEEDKPIIVDDNEDTFDLNEHLLKTTGGTGNDGDDNDEEADEEFEDVPLEKEQEEETQEEREFNRAVIESIYEQYGDKESNQDDIQMIPAQSQVLKPIETQENHSENPLGLNFGSSLLFGTSEVQPIQVADKEPEIIIDQTDKNETQDKQKQLSNENSEDSPLIATNRPKVDKEREILEVEELIEKDEDVPNEKDQDQPKETKKTQTVPSWFNDQIDKNSLNFKPISKAEETKEGKINEDEQAGLIPWYEAKDMLNMQSDESQDDEELEDVTSHQSDTEEQAKKMEHLNEKEQELVKLIENESKDERLRSSDSIEINEANNPETKQLEEKATTTENEDDKERKKPDVILDYVFNEDEERLAEKQLVSEEMDHERLKQEINSVHEIPLNDSGTSITEEQLLQERLQKQKRDAEEVTQTMINDVQELLRRFGIPFITAPMEAEAQCAELFQLGLVDGIITDDSDCFLFGGDRIYKNMFNQKQYVECYLKDDIAHKLGLNQDRLIELGLLLGSDYTDGVKGIGPVLAMEILAEFGNLSRFKKWFDDCSLKGANDSSTTLKKNLLNRIKNNKLYLSSLFPDEVVFQAYKSAQVDSNKEPFKWGVPDLDQIRSFLMYNVGWSQSRVDEVMIPLIRDMNKKLREGSQSTINEFFPVSHQQYTKQVLIGKRLKAAADKLNKSTYS